MRAREWWAQRTLRERQLLILATLVVVVAAWILGVIRPGMQRLHALETTVVGQREQLREMQQAARELATLRDGAANAIPSGESPLLITQQLTRDMELEPFVGQAQSQGDAGVQISFKELPYESLLHWLAQVTQRGLRVRSLTLVPVGADGQCQVQVTLEASVVQN
ncbi:MAG: type II secretion system protein GspM [Candidatus Macondimonas sp.]